MSERPDPRALLVWGLVLGLVAGVAVSKRLCRYARLARQARALRLAAVAGMVITILGAGAWMLL